MLRILSALIVNMHKKIRISCLQRNCSVIISVKHIFFGNIPNYDMGTVLPGIVPIRIFWRLCQSDSIWKSVLFIPIHKAWDFP